MEHLTGRLGFCCKWVSAEHGLPLETYADEKRRAPFETPMNQGGVQIKRLRALATTEQEAVISAMVVRNVETLWRQLHWIAQLPPGQRMFRITSTFLPASAMPEFAEIHGGRAVREALSGLAGVRDFATANGIRLGTHPGQHTVLSSPDEEKVANSIADLEYHGELAAWMGYSGGWHPDGYTVNIHANVRQDPGLIAFAARLDRLSDQVRNLLTVENDEFSCGLDDILASPLPARIPVILDIHHHWVRSGEHIMPDDPRIAAVAASWRGVRPLAHASFPRPETVLPVLGLPAQAQPGLVSRDALVAAGARLAGEHGIRSHADLPWDEATSRWALSHLSWADIEIEAGGKNLASAALARLLEGGSLLETGPVADA